MTKVLIDGDIFRYRCAFAAERTEYLVEHVNGTEREYTKFESKKEVDGFCQRIAKDSPGSFTKTWSRKDLQPRANCLQIVKSSLENCLDAVRSHFSVKELDYRIWLSGKGNFREGIAVTRKYKGNRDSTPRPSYYMEVADYLVETWGAVYTEGIEADDAIGIAAMEERSAGRDYIIVSNDKDLRQVPGSHYDWIKKEHYSISPKESKTLLFTQILSGDATDNIPGLEGVGPATAAKILDGARSPEEMVDSVVSTYILEFETYPDKYPKVPWGTYLAEMWALVYILKGQVPADTYQDEWKNTKEGKYFLEKYKQNG